MVLLRCLIFILLMLPIILLLLDGFGFILLYVEP